MSADKKQASPKAWSVLASGLAHELRNPLNSAKLQLSVLLRSAEGKSLSDTATARIVAAKGELRRMSDLVDDYLSLSEPRVIEPRGERLHGIVDAAIRRMRTDLGLANTIVSDVAATLPLVLADAGRITQVLVHLLKNSVEALEDSEEPRVQISARPRENLVEVRVEDNGPGMDGDIRDVALEPFTTTKAAGTGLGLTLVDRLVRAHGGTLRFETSSAGTSMYFSLPIAP